MNVRTFAVIAVVGLLICAVGLWFDAGLMAHAWLAAALTWGLLPLGALAALLTWGLTGGGWGELGAPTWRALTACLPLFALALLPLLLFARSALFPWTQPLETLPEVVRHKHLYLNTPFFVIRTLVYFLIWCLFAALVGVWRPRVPGAAVCAGGLVALLYTLAFFGFDWMLSLEPKFYTDVFGLWLAVTLPAGATALVLLRPPVTRGGVDIGRRADLANLWFALLLGWAFIAFAQYIIIWSGNIPDEIEWYLARGHGVWRGMAWLVCLLFFVVPTLALLFGGFKRNGRWLQRLAGVVLLGYVLQMQWWILPAADAPQWPLLWMAPLCLITLGAAMLALWSYHFERAQVRHER
ncbi:hypothetical protein [Salinisphaera aquimarina]|uniref:Quinol:cytochrome c oxidoreductase quinone-binding subunit 2 n=1 Tax=Salinisphaera aquimarina TaxID=2094031 RepID=A0ABV7EMU5_9GAMM